MKINANQSSDTHSEQDTIEYLSDEDQLVLQDVVAEMIEKLQKAGCTVTEVSGFLSSAMAGDMFQLALAIVAIRSGIENRQRAAAASEDIF